MVGLWGWGGAGSWNRNTELVGGFKHLDNFPFHIWDVIPTPLTNSIIFQRGRYTNVYHTNQFWKLPIYNGFTYLRIVNPVVFKWHFQVANLQIVFHIWSQTRQGNWFRHLIGTWREVVWVPFWSIFFHLYPGWWLGTFLMFHIYWECHHPDELIFFRGVGSTTNQLSFFHLYTDMGSQEPYFPSYHWPAQSMESMWTTLIF
jgi:hypothetical protein